MGAVVLSIGSELLRGDIVDTNAAYLTRGLSRLDLDVQWVAQIGDDLESLRAAVRRALETAEVTVCTGGLGPTQDDLTREAIAGVMGETMVLDEALVADLKGRFRDLRRPMVESNLKQATLIPSARAIPNPNGTAPGWFVEKDGRAIIAMPGPPSEMRPMWEDSVVPQLAASRSEHLAMRSLITWGIGESSLEDRIREIISWRPDVTVATYAKSAGVQVHVTARALSLSEADILAGETEQRLRSLLGTAIFGTGDTTLSRVVGAELRRQGLTVATMESCSAGEVANLITDTAGASDYFPGGIVAYTRNTKLRYGVDAATMDEHGLISSHTAVAMAQAARRKMDADVGIGVTGVAGQDPIEGQPAGTCFVAVSSVKGDRVRHIHRRGSRETVKAYAAQSALDLLRRHLTGIEDDS